MVVVGAKKLEAAEHALHLERFPALELLARLGNVSLLDAVNGLLHKHADQLVGRFEDGCPHEDFQLGNG